MPKYNVESPLRHDGEDYPEGSAVEMSAKQAEELIGMGVLSEIKTEATASGITAPESPKERIAAIRDAIGKMDKADASLFLKDGTTPDTKALTAILGWNVTAEERNAAIIVSAE